MIAELRKVDRTLEERTAFLHRIALAKEIYVSLFEDKVKEIARQDWENMFTLNQQTEGAIFTHQLADMIENQYSAILTFHLWMDKLMIVAEYIAFGNRELESNLPEAIITAANQRVMKVISKHILENM